MVFAQGFMGSGCGIPSCAPAKKALSPALYIGYAGTSGQGRGLAVGFDGNVPGTNLRDYRWNVGFYGLQLAAEAPYQASDAVTVLVSGSWLVPFKATGVEERWLTGFDQTREWSAKPQWYTLNATGEYKLNESTAFLGGFMYDNKRITLKDPDSIAAFGWRPGDTTDITLATYIPYLGISSTYGGITAGFATFPYLFGDVKVAYNETFNALPALYDTKATISRGYFIQTWVEFNTTRAGANIGAYAAYNLLHANASSSLNVPGFSGDYGLTVDRQIWMLGAKFAFSFNLPLFRR